MDNDTTSKRCSQCKEYKYTTEFHKDKNRKDGFYPVCKSCVSLNHSRRNLTRILYDIPLNLDCKTCRVCKVTKHIDEFSLCRWNPDGLQSRCKKCYSDYYYQNKDTISVNHHKYYMENRDRIIAMVKLYVANNTEKISAMKKAHYVKTRHFHLEKRRAYSREYSIANRDKRYVKDANRRARVRLAEGKHTSKEINVLFETQDGLCFWCDTQLINPFTKEGIGEKPHLDHVIPISKKGRNDIGNLVWACWFCNLSKGDKLPSEWSGSNGKWKE